MTTTEVASTFEVIPEKKRTADLVEKTGLFMLLLIFGLIVFVFATSYSDRFATNSSGLFKIATSGIFLALAVISGRYEKVKPLRSILYAFFVASFVNVVTWYFAVLVRDDLFALLGVSISTIPGMTAAKFSEALLAVGTILVLVKLSGDGLASVYIKRGNLNWAMRIGFLALLNLTATAFIIASFMDRDIESIIPNLPWFIVFALANGFMEELWFRGLFLGRLQPLVGESGAIWMTSIWFGILHILAVYVSGIAALIFGVVAFTLGFAFALLMQKTRTIWGATIFHAAADLYWFIAFGF